MKNKHFLVCIKQTPKTDKVRVDPQTGCLIRQGIEAEINPFDEYAVETAVRLKERFGAGAKVSAVTMGPPAAEEVLRYAVSKGADNVFHLCDTAFAGSDTWATSYALSQAAKKISSIAGEIDLIICGKQTNDSDTGHIGPQVSAWLDYPGSAFVSKIEQIEETGIILKRMTEDGFETIRLKFPSVISVLKDVYPIRIAGLKTRISAKNAKITKFTAADIGCSAEKLGIKGSPTSVISCFVPQRDTNSVLIEHGTAAEKAAELIGLLKKADAIK